MESNPTCHPHYWTCRICVYQQLSEIWGFAAVWGEEEDWIIPYQRYLLGCQHCHQCPPPLSFSIVFVALSVRGNTPVPPLLSHLSPCQPPGPPAGDAAGEWRDGETRHNSSPRHWHSSALPWPGHDWGAALQPGPAHHTQHSVCHEVCRQEVPQAAEGEEIWKGIQTQPK